MHRALEGEDLLLGRLDAEMAEDRLVGGLLLAAGDDDAHAVERQQRHRPQLYAAAAIERPGRGEVAVAQALDTIARLIGLMTRQAGLGAETDIDRGTFA